MMAEKITKLIEHEEENIQGVRVVKAKMRLKVAYSFLDEEDDIQH